MTDAPIFIVGTGRSGTTLLRLMRNAHPRIHLTHEASFYPGTRRPLRRAAGGQEWLDVYLRSFAFRWLGIHAADVRAVLPDSLPLFAWLSSARAPDAAEAQRRLLALNPDAWAHYDPDFSLPPIPDAG